MKTPNRQFKLQSLMLPAPTRGLNSRDPLAATEPGYALSLENFIITSDAVAVRKGVGPVLQLDGVSQIETLAAYNYGGNKKLFACGGGSIYLCDPAEEDSQPLKNACLNNRWQTLFYQGYQYFFNGADLPQVYTPSGTLQNAAFEETGFELSKLIGGCVYKNRLILLEKGSLAFHYTTTAGAVQGPLERFDLAQMSGLGGELVLALPWVYSTADGKQESQLVLISSQGEVFIYAGDDPADADAWGLRGRYKIPRPQGRRAGICFGGDIALVCENGYYLLSNLLSTPVAQRASAFSDTINPDVSTQKSIFGSFGWDLVLWEQENMLLANVPQAAGAVQHVLNTLTGGWSRFNGINAAALCVLDGELYFATGGAISQYGAVTDEEIAWKLELAYSNLGTAFVKAVKKIQIFLTAYHSLKYTTLMAVDFQKSYTAHASNASPILSKWDVAKWDQSSWGAEGKAITETVLPTCPAGRYFSFGLSGTTGTQGVKFIGVNLWFKTGKNA